ncbi:ATP-binding protein [Providencia sp. PROV060]|uniref:ATP-binding protein n=1 Tax=Providencia sp. PROV060 TaxID=2949788 RepID=UPI00234B5A34|nr:ATP-binding protein [Providencia sp. PROV060]EJD6045576.1 ATP-binding protein [Providencia rettgeri]EJD6049645.1 ATP-binding protein [Providencia rettgeri]ELR5103447.1 ATP-binding protein [Providencia rettgeri]MDI7244480.1 ATP-binding protein [Providencia rettgeri]
MSILVGEVIGINGIKITIKLFEDSNKDTLYYDGKIFKGVSIRELVKIKRGFKDIICIVEGEFLDEKKYIDNDLKRYYIRTVELRPIGYFERKKFNEGVKHLPLIKDKVYLLEEDKLPDIFGRNNEDGFIIGKLLKEDYPISLDWKRLFNTHIGIFGNTGSGKSNTLTKLYTTLFENKVKYIKGKSKFVVIDFNGEYTSEQLTTTEYKSVYKLNTNREEDKFPLVESEFWNVESLSILFQATQNTQKPFINRVVLGRERYKKYPNSLDNYFKKTFERIFTVASPKADSLDLIREVVSLLELDGLHEKLTRITWNSSKSYFQIKGIHYFDSDSISYIKYFKEMVDEVSITQLDIFTEFKLRCYLQLINDLIFGFVQYEFIQPLLKRIESSLNSLRKVIKLTGESAAPKVVTIISLRKCNQDIKKILPLLISKHYYQPHKDNVSNPPENTVHLIIDEAHNILSHQSTRESESWKDYRLEQFEEIIKEGRKFGFFLTLSSQRPADISPTIMSQIHNFFIHKLVNDRDLFLIDNTISTLDRISRNMIPNLSKGCCIVTGTSFDIPMVLQVDLLEKSKQPDSEDVDLALLWSDNQIEQNEEE